MTFDQSWQVALPMRIGDEDTPTTAARVHNQKLPGAIAEAVPPPTARVEAGE